MNSAPMTDQTPKRKDAVKVTVRLHGAVLTKIAAYAVKHNMSLAGALKSMSMRYMDVNGERL